MEPGPRSIGRTQASPTVPIGRLPHKRQLKQVGACASPSRHRRIPPLDRGDRFGGNLRLPYPAAEDLREGGPEGGINFGHGNGDALRDKRGDPESLNTAGHDAAEMLQVGLHIERNPMERHPPPYAHPERRNLPFPAVAHHPDADPAVTPLPDQTETRQRADQPFLKIPYERPYVRAAGLQIQNDIGDALPGAMVGVAPPAARHMHREAPRRQEFGRVGACPRRVKGRMLEQPYQLGRPARPHGRCTPLHLGHGGFVVNRTIIDSPFKHLESSTPIRYLASVFAVCIVARRGFAVVAELVDAQR